MVLAMTQARLLVCGFGSFPAAPRNPSALVIEALAAAGWSPSDVETDYLSLPVSWTHSTDLILDALRARPADAVLVVGVATSADAFRVETLGRNRASRSLGDADGQLWTRPVISPDGAGVIAATAPSQEVLDGLLQANLPARLSDDAGDYLCNFTLYSLLATQAAPVVGFLHVPQVRECAEDASFDIADVERAGRAAASAYAAAVSRPDASRRTA
jgi:pyroglutamyl-peptidase